MTATEFVIELTKNKKKVLISNEYITGIVNVISNILSSNVIVENCVFEEGVFFERISLNCGIKFVKCEFLKNISFTKCSANNYDLEFNFNGFQIEFNESKVNGLYFNDLNFIERGVTICNKSIINKFIIETIISKKGSISIDDSTINDALVIRQANILNDISIRSNCNINANVRFENNKAGSFTFTESNFKKSVQIWSGEIGLLTFNDGLFEDSVSITAVPISSYMTIVGTEFKKNICFNLKDIAKDTTENKEKIIYGLLNKIYIESGKFGEQLIINGEDKQVDELIITTSKQLFGDLHFNSCNILDAKISGNNYNSNIIFNHSFFNKLNFDFFYNYSTLSLISVKSYNPNSEFAINHSNLGKTHFFNAFLNTFDKVTIYNSVITEIITANVKWFEDSKLNPSVASQSFEYTYKKEIYRQIKYALEKQGDRIASLRFKSLEMNAFKNESFSKTKCIFKIFHIDRFILWLGLSNNYGQNWFKPILLAIGFTIFFYSLIIVGISENLTYSFNLSKESIVLTWNELLNFTYLIPQLMNPATNLSKSLPDYTNISFLVYLWDYFLKISLAFFIFQIISAFRKYMK